uniref:Uncharacterized protein n=1 Tax=viral metagenome TaxID=1070528 RepID=A0A6C0JZU0_9ZZZZ
MAYKTKTRKTRKNRKGGKAVINPNQTQSIKNNKPQMSKNNQYESIKTMKNHKKRIECSGANIPCNTLDTQYKGKLNQTWDTCIKMNGIQNHILYITPNNVVVKSIESAQIPEFIVSIDNVPTACKIMIEDQYISCFLYVCGNWYAIMRLLGKTINTEFLARTEKNRAFFKLSDIDIDIDKSNPNNGSGLIVIPENQYTTVEKKHILSTSTTPVIQLTANSFTNIDKKSVVNNQKVFNVLQRFRQEKVAGNAVKQGVAADITLDVVDLFT